MEKKPEKPLVCYGTDRRNDAPQAATMGTKRFTSRGRG
jgi:hypothetical protein